MSNVWFAIPSARPPEEVEPVLRAWRERGYKIALWRDSDVHPSHPKADFWMFEFASKYPGYAVAVNALTARILDQDPDCDWIVTGGDDTLPDPNHSAYEIARECGSYFHDRVSGCTGPWPICEQKATFGVMQPTGDRFAGGSIDRICGSPWMGRAFCERINGGRGPFWPEYTHMYVDEEMFEVTKKLGILWQRPDLIHLHKHFMRESDDVNSKAIQKPVPAHLVEVNSPEHWSKYGGLFARRKNQGFPGHEPLPVHSEVTV